MLTTGLILSTYYRSGKQNADAEALSMIQWPSVNAVLEVRHSESAPVEMMCLSQQVVPDNEGTAQCFLLSCNLYCIPYCIPCVLYYHSMPIPLCIYQGPRER